MKKLLAMALALVMALGVTTMAWAEDSQNPEREKGYKAVGGADYSELPAGPTDMTAAVIEVGKMNAQYVLDGAYGDITGKTIKFTEDISEELILGRPTKYVGSNTKYYSDRAFSTEIDYAAAMANTVNGHYKRTVSDVTFTAADGVTVAGFTANSGQVASTSGKQAYDYVRDSGSYVNATNNGYYCIANFENIKFEGLTITGRVDFDGYEQSCRYTVNGISFVNCTFPGNDSKTDRAIRIAGSTDSLALTNLTVTGCTFRNCKEGVLAYSTNGIEIKNNTFENIATKAIELGSKDNALSGSVTIKENYIKDTNDRAIRLGTFNTGASLVVENNVMVNAKDENGEMFKAEGKPDTISLENNYWGGKDAATAVSDNGGVTVPTKTGVTGGTFKGEVKADMLAVAWRPSGTRTAATLLRKRPRCGITTTPPRPLPIRRRTRLRALPRRLTRAWVSTPSARC